MNDDEGEEMHADANIQINVETKTGDNASKISDERRALNSDRRINNGYDYMGPARRMNLDRRK